MAMAKSYTFWYQHRYDTNLRKYSRSMADSDSKGEATAASVASGLVWPLAIWLLGALVLIDHTERRRVAAVERTAEEERLLELARAELRAVQFAKERGAARPERFYTYPPGNRSAIDADAWLWLPPVPEDVI